jgi:hypothetical protein
MVRLSQILRKTKLPGLKQLKISVGTLSIKEKLGVILKKNWATFKKKFNKLKAGCLKSSKQRVKK